MLSMRRRVHITALANRCEVTRLGFVMPHDPCWISVQPCSRVSRHRITSTSHGVGYCASVLSSILSFAYALLKTDWG